ncbi:MAG: hypothetical protein HC841_00095 [Verrucomicrobiae bacterium]|nr:hypothetical protein [Verrucomicrobiae bacterium]
MTGPRQHTEQKAFEVLRVVDEFVLRHGCSVSEACRKLGIKHYTYCKYKKWVKTGKWHE